MGTWRGSHLGGNRKQPSHRRTVQEGLSTKARLWGNHRDDAGLVGWNCYCGGLKDQGEGEITGTLKEGLP